MQKGDFVWGININVLKFEPTEGWSQFKSVRKYCQDARPGSPTVRPGILDTKAKGAGLPRSQSHGQRIQQLDAKTILEYVSEKVRAKRPRAEQTLLNRTVVTLTQSEDSFRMITEPNGDTSRSLMKLGRMTDSLLICKPQIEGWIVI